MRDPGTAPPLSIARGSSVRGVAGARADGCVGVESPSRSTALKNESVRGPNEWDPIAQNTKLGWMLFGPLEWETLNHSTHNVTVNKIATEQSTEQLIESFWTIENDSVTVKTQHSKKEANILKEFNESIKVGSPCFALS